jgi:hypothetical protein
MVMMETSLEVLKGVGIVDSIIVNFLLVISWVWLHLSDFYLEVLKDFHFVNKICVVVLFVFFLLCMFSA